MAVRMIYSGHRDGVVRTESQSSSCIIVAALKNPGLSNAIAPYISSTNPVARKTDSEA